MCSSVASTPEYAVLICGFAWPWRKVVANAQRGAQDSSDSACACHLSKLALTASASSGEPSWKTTSRRSVNVTERRSSETVHDSARPGAGSPVERSAETSPSRIWAEIREVSCEFRRDGSRPAGAAAWARTKCPLGTDAPADGRAVAFEQPDSASPRPAAARKLRRPKRFSAAIGTFLASSESPALGRLGMVRKTGLEPARREAQEPKSCVSASFTTRAVAGRGDAPRAGEIVTHPNQSPWPTGVDPGRGGAVPCGTSRRRRRRLAQASRPRSRRSLATWPLARTLYCASVTAPCSSTTTVERMSPS